MEEKIKRLIERYKFISESLKEIEVKMLDAKADTYDTVIKDLARLLEGDFDD